MVRLDPVPGACKQAQRGAHLSIRRDPRSTSHGPTLPAERQSNAQSIARFRQGCLAADLGPHGITVNALTPGFIDTRMAHLPDGSGHEHDTTWFKDIYLRHGRILLGRAGTPEDVAGPAFFLCSKDARYVTGQILAVDGGVTSTF
jgi:enoyl-[acyl-carrier-protein] reductase (NADH)